MVQLIWWEANCDSIKAKETEYFLWYASVKDNVAISFNLNTNIFYACVTSINNNLFPYLLYLHWPFLKIKLIFLKLHSDFLVLCLDPFLLPWGGLDYFTAGLAWWWNEN